MAGDLPSWAAKNGWNPGKPAKLDSSLPSWARANTAASDVGAVVVRTPEKKSGGIIGTVKHVAGQTVGDLYDVAIHTPGGIVALGKAAAQDELDLLKGKQAKRTTDILKGSAKQTGLDLARPFTHPGDPHLGNFGLAALGVVGAGAGAASRVAAAGDAVRAGEGAAGAAKALTTRPAQDVRTFEHQGVPIERTGSRSPAVRAAHRAVIDPLLQKYKDVPLIGAAAKVSKGVEKEARLEGRLRGATLQTFTVKAKQAGMLKRAAKPGKRIARYTDDALARQHALRVVAEGVPVETRVGTHQQYLERGYNPSKLKNPEIAEATRKQFEQGHTEQVKLNQLASKYVHNVKGHDGNLHPRIRPEYKDIIETYEWAKRVTGSREELLQLIDKLDEGKIAGRVAAPGREFFGQGEDFTGGELRVPTVPGFKEPRSRAPLPEIGAQGAVNIPQAPGSLRHPYLGKAYKGGKIRNDVVNLINESAQEAQRYWTLVHVTDRIKPAIHDTPQGPHDIPIKVEALPGQDSMKEARAMLEASHQDPSKLASFSYAFEAIRNEAFPKFARNAKDNQRLALAQSAALKERGMPGYKFVDSRLLGGLNRRNPLLSAYDYRSLRTALQVADAVNNASKLAILYLKPAYIAPNLLGNVGLNLVQQGFAAPANLKRAARLNARVDAHTYNQILEAVGEGVTGSLEAKTGRLAGAANKGAHFYGNVIGVDKYPRIAAFLYEAGKEGFRTPAELKRLFEQENRGKLSLVAERTDRAMIDYGDLSPVEQAIVRRVIFFYPWVKGASKWSVRFVTEHPVQAAAASQSARVGKEQQQAALGPDLPSWAQGLVPVGMKNGNPLTTNPSSISILSTPAQLAQSVLSGTASDNLTPALALAQGYKHPLAALEDQVRSLPEAPLLGLARPSKTFPAERSNPEKLLLYLLGSGLTPRETNRAQLARSAFFEKHPPR